MRRIFSRGSKDSPSDSNSRSPASSTAVTGPPRPIRLVYFDEKGKFRMDPEAVATLQLVKEPIGVVSVCGRARQGKSFILNQLLGRSNGFQVASTHKPCTKGLWLWSSPIKQTALDGTEYNLLLLDSEGIDAYDQTGTYSTQIFSLAVLLSSMFIYNQMGGIDEASLDRLSLVTQMTKHIRVKSSGGTSSRSELGQFSPIFVWLLRDFYLDLVEDNRKITPRDYLEIALRPVQGSGGDIGAKNEIRDSIRALFPDRECFTLVRPLNNEKDLQRLDQISLEKLRPEFGAGLDALTKFVFEKTRPKQLGGTVMTGPLLVGITQSYLDALNNGAVPTITSSWQSVEETECRRAYDTGLEAYNSAFDQSKAPEEGALREEHEEAVRKALAMFNANAVGVGSARKKYEDLLHKDLKKRFADYKKNAFMEADMRCTSTIQSMEKQLRAACHASNANMDNVVKAYKAWNESQTQTQHVINPVSEDGNTTLGLSKVTEAVFREACNEMVVLGQLALSFLESLAWRHFCNKVKLFKPHSRRSATRDIVEMYCKRKLSMMKLIGNKQRVSLTTDIWTAPTTKCSYMVITAHFVDEFWKLRKLIIGFKNVTDHTGATISSVLVECMAEWGIKKLFTITVDNATANTSALKKFKEAYTLLDSNSLVLGGEYMHMRCCAHIINLVVKDGFNEVDSSVQAIRNAVLYVRASTNRVKAFELRVESGKMTRGSLTLDCQTRWNSTYLMLTRALKFRKAFEKTEAEDKLYNEHFQETVEGKKRIGPPTVDDWDAVERLVKFLIIFYNSTLVVSASTSVSSTKGYNEIVTIERNLIKLSNDSDESLRSKARAMRQKFDKYWDGLKEMNRLLIVASVFDPRHKMKFAEMCFDKLYGKDSVEAIDLKRSVKSVLTRLFEEYSAGLTTAGNNITSQSSSQSQTLSAEDQVVDDVELDTEEGYERMDCLYNEMADEGGFEDEGTELDIYLEEKCEKRKGIQMAGVEFDLLGWWKVNSIKFPVLSAIARDILAMQVSSVASESAFSTSGRVVTPARSLLTHYTIEVLMCLEQWLKCEYHLNDKGLVTKEQLLADIELQDELQREFESAVSRLTI